MSSRLELSIEGLVEGQPIPAIFALGKPHPSDHVTFSDNVSPRFEWQGAPTDTQSFALIVCDMDAPTRGDDVNKEGRSVPYELPRGDFYHLVLVDIPKSVSTIPAGALCRGVTARGKPCGPTEYGVQGKNDYTSWFAGDAKMEGVYGGYDGPCPPWNDERRHRYVTTLYALSVPSLSLTGEFGGPDAVAALAPHCLAQVSVTGTYAIYEKAR